MQPCMYQYRRIKDDRSTVRYHGQKPLNGEEYSFKIDVEIPVEDIFCRLFERSEETNPGVCKKDINPFEGFRDPRWQCLYVHEVHGIGHDTRGAFSKRFDRLFYRVLASACNKDLCTFV